MNILRNLLGLGLILSALLTGTVNANETVDCFYSATAPCVALPPASMQSEASKSHPACQ
jgi:hypothetical protein